VLSMALEGPLPTPVPKEAEVLAAVPPPGEVGAGTVAHQ